MITALENVGESHVSILKLQQLHCGSLGMYKQSCSKDVITYPCWD